MAFNRNALRGRCVRGPERNPVESTRGKDAHSNERLFSKTSERSRDWRRRRGRFFFGEADDAEASVFRGSARGDAAEENESNRETNRVTESFDPEHELAHARHRSVLSCAVVERAARGPRGSRVVATAALKKPTR
jgi:hypothetical protein